MRTILYSVMALGLFMSIPAHAEEERVKHYAYDIPENTNRAIQLYYENLGIIRYTLDTGALNDQKLELIHERSYALETAVDYLRFTHKDHAAALKTLSQQVHEVHEASEEHDGKHFRPAFAALNKADDILDLLPRK